jgi:hypothetical protein
LLTPAAASSGTDVIADSYQPTAPIRNQENIGLEPVWPYDGIGDSGSLTALAERTFTCRPVHDSPDWSFDAIDAARLDMASEVQSNLITITERYQGYISGMASPGHEPYIEQSSGVATALDEALVQDYDGLLRIAPAWPAGWDVAGTVYVRRGTKVDVQVENGVPVTVAIEAGATQTMRVRSPWPGQPVEVADGRTGAVVVPGHRCRRRRRPCRQLLPSRAGLRADDVVAVRGGHRHAGNRREEARRRDDRAAAATAALFVAGRVVQQRGNHRRLLDRRREL